MGSPTARRNPRRARATISANGPTKMALGRSLSASASVERESNAAATKNRARRRGW